MPAFDVYVWQQDVRRGSEYLKWTAREIVADDRSQAARRAVIALRKRPGLYNNEVLRRFNGYLHGYGECPEGYALEIKKVADGPRASACVI